MNNGQLKLLPFSSELWPSNDQRNNFTCSLDSPSPQESLKNEMNPTSSLNIELNSKKNQEHKESKVERITLKISKIKKSSFSKSSSSSSSSSQDVYKVSKVESNFIENVSLSSKPKVSRSKRKRKLKFDSKFSSMTKVNSEIWKLGYFLKKVTVESIDCYFPNEILIKIFEEVMLSEDNDLITLLNISQVCEYWRQLILKTPKLWKKLDLSKFKDTSTGSDLINLCEIGTLSNVTHVNFSGWTCALSRLSFSKFLNACGPNLKYICLRECYKINGDDLIMISEKCPNLKEIDLSRVTFSSKGYEKRRRSNDNKSLEKANPIFSKCFRKFLCKFGSNLTSLILAENKLPSLSTIFTDILVSLKNLLKRPNYLTLILFFYQNNCPNLQLLDLSNIENTGFAIPIHKLQEACPLLKVLRLANLPINAYKDNNLGFPNLEELSIPCSNDFINSTSNFNHNDTVIGNITKNSENLKLLDIRGLRNVSASCLIKIPAWNLQNLALDNCSRISLSLEMIISKVSFVLIITFTN